MPRQTVFYNEGISKKTNVNNKISIQILHHIEFSLKYKKKNTYI